VLPTYDAIDDSPLTVLKLDTVTNGRLSLPLWHEPVRWVLPLVYGSVCTAD
jgi:hypothetical protein